MKTLTAQVSPNATEFSCARGTYVTGNIVGNLGGVVSHHGVSGNKSNWRIRANSKPVVVSRKTETKAPIMLHAGAHYKLRNQAQAYSYSATYGSQ